MRIRTIAMSALVCLSFCSGAIAQWVRTNSPFGRDISCLVVSGTNLFAGSRGGGVFLTTDDGTIWQPMINGLGDRSVISLAICGSNLFAGTIGIPGSWWDTPAGAILISSNEGATWQTVDSSMEGWVSCFTGSDSNVFAGTLAPVEGAVARILTSKNGTIWNPIPAFGPLKNSRVSSLATSGANLFAGTSGMNPGLYRSTDNGTSWQMPDSGFNGGGIFALVPSPNRAGGTDLFAGTGIGVYLSTDEGLSWTSVSTGLPDYVNIYGWISALAVSPNGTGGINLFAGTAFDGVFVTTNNGASWSAVNTGLADSSVSSLAVSGTYLFAGTGSGAWRRPLSEMVTTAVIEVGGEIAKEFSLRQNYPNPFNPSTTISYGLPRQSHVLLTVYSTLGQKVAEIVNGEMEAGNHEVTFDASHLASGAYLYRLTAGAFMETKTFLLVR